MKPKRVTKSFTQQEPIPEEAVARVVEILRSGRLHRYNLAPGEESEAAALEREFAAWQGVRYCVACASGGYALHVALRAAGLEPGDKVLANAWTLAPVPGAGAEQQALVDDIKSKIRRYQQYNNDVSNWISFGSADPGASVYRVPLSMMP